MEKLLLKYTLGRVCPRSCCTVLLCCLAAWGVLGCNAEAAYLRYALEEAGENRGELEAVLEHYKDDPEKLASAKFLISNMPAHSSYKEEYITGYYDLAHAVLMSDSEPEWQRDTLLAITENSFAHAGCHTLPDTKIISAETLIKSIDQAFELREKSPWTSHLTFEEFCEWLLPYKVTELQTIDAWRDTMQACFAATLSGMIPDDDEYLTVRKTSDVVRSKLNETIKRYGLYTKSGLPLLRSDLYLHMTYGDIPDYVRLGALAYRSVGIPAVIDETPVGSRHTAASSWFVVLSDRGDEVLTEWDISSLPGMGFFPEERGPKVYRNLYAINPKRWKYRKKAKFVMDFPLSKHDVTGRYFLTSDLELPIKREKLNLTRDKYVYIAAGIMADSFTRDWSIVDFGRINRGLACFENMGREVLYTVFGYNGSGLFPLTEPFILHKDGSVEYLSADSVKDASFDKWRNKTVINR